MGFLVKRAIWEQPGNWWLQTSSDWPCTHANETFSLHERILSARLWGFPQGTRPTLAKSLKPWSPWRSILKWVSHGKHNLTLASNVCKAVLRSFVLDPQQSPNCHKCLLNFLLSWSANQQWLWEMPHTQILRHSWGAQNKDFGTDLQTELIRV